MPAGLFDLSGRRALITGASQGLGLAMARGLGSAGANLVINGRDQDRLDRAIDSLAAEGLTVSSARFDITRAQEVAAAVAAIEADRGPIDILVNNAGIQRRGPIEDFAEADWREVLDVNLTGAFLVAQQVGRRMIARRQGKIINICSLMSEVGRRTIVPYTTAKGGLKMLTRALAVEWGPYNIQVNGIGPGYFATEMNRALIDDADFNTWVCGQTPTGRWGQPEELAGTAIFLASRASDYLTGQVIYVDGGMLAAV